MANREGAGREVGTIAWRERKEKEARRTESGG